MKVANLAALATAILHLVILEDVMLNGIADVWVVYSSVFGQTSSCAEFQTPSWVCINMSPHPDDSSKL